MHDCVLTNSARGDAYFNLRLDMTAKNSSFIHPLAIVLSNRLGREAPLGLCLAISRVVRRRGTGKWIRPRLAPFDVQSIVELQSDG